MRGVTRGAALCCIALTACGFDGAEGEDSDLGQGPVLDPLPFGNVTLSGSISSPHPGAFTVALLPAGTKLPADNPCLRAGATTALVDATTRTFSFPNVLPGPYLLVGIRLSTGKLNFERTAVAIDVPATSATHTAAPLALLPELKAEILGDDRRGPGGDDQLVAWTVPIGFLTSAFALRDRDSHCVQGTPLPMPPAAIGGDYQLPADDLEKVKLVVERGEQMAIRLARPD
jgi:hypothetical protein